MSYFNSFSYIYHTMLVTIKMQNGFKKGGLLLFSFSAW